MERVHEVKDGFCAPCADDEHASVDHELDNDGKYVRSICTCCGEEAFGE